MKTKPLMGLAVMIAVIVTGVYVMNAGSGNTDTVGNCQLTTDQRTMLKQASAGEVAAFRVLDDPLNMNQIAFKDREGKPRTLAEWKGKTVLFNLWATWCPPCREEMPYFETLQKSHGGDSFEVVPVSIDSGNNEKPLGFYAETGLKDLPFYHDGSMRVFDILKQNAIALGMPTTMIVDQNGCGIGVLSGAAHWASPDAVKLIETTIDLGKNG